MTLRGIRRRNLKKQGFFGFERQALVNVVFKRSGWLRLVRRDRAREFEGMKDIAQQRNWSPARLQNEWAKYIREKYADNNWLRADGTPDAWMMFRALRAEAIRQGRWAETPGYRGRRKVQRDDGGLVRIDKGDVKAQKARYRDRQKNKKERR